MTHCLASKNSGSGIFAFNNSRVESCVATGNVNDGITFAPGCSILGCVANNNGTQTTGSGFVATNDAVGSVIEGCTAQGNAGYGISVDGSSLVSHCTVYANQLDGILVYDKATSVIDCSVALNGQTNGNGITCRPEADDGIIARCVVAANGTGTTGVGILTHANCLIEHNSVSHNKSAGIKTSGTNNRIDSNLAYGNGSYGVDSFAATADFIVRNTCFGNGGAVTATATVNYNPKSGAYFGILAHPGDANPSPWANLH